MEIIKIPIDQLTPDPNNAKDHPDWQIEQIVNSIEQFGNLDPIGVWGEDNLIVEGHGRYEALKELGYHEAECIRLDWLTEEERRAYALAHNKLTMNSGFIPDALDLNLDAIGEIDMGLFGFDIDAASIIPEAEEDAFTDETPINEHGVERGQVWQCGKHFVMCGDSTNEDDVAILMGEAKADIVFTDPPYNVEIVGGSHALPKTNRGGQRIANDNFDTDEEAGQKLWLPAFTNMRKYSKDCCAIYVTMPQGGTHMMMMMMMMDKAGWQVKHELIWRKQSLVLGRQDYNYQHEPICYGWNKTHKFVGKGKYHTTSVWDFDRPTKSKEHPTMKPIELIGECLLDASEDDDVVMDLFGGSGSTLIACEQLNRKCYMMELDPHYVDVILTRWENHTGEKAVIK